MQAEGSRQLLQNCVPHESQASGTAKANQTHRFADDLETGSVLLLSFIARFSLGGLGGALEGAHGRTQ